MESSDYISLFALFVAAAGWLVSYLFANRLASKNRCAARLDEAEHLAYSIANIIFQHLLLSGDDSGSRGRILSIQNDARRLRGIINDIFDKRIPQNTTRHLNYFWEVATSEPVTLTGNRMPLFEHSKEIIDIQKLPALLINSAREKK